MGSNRPERENSSCMRKDRSGTKRSTYSKTIGIFFLDRTPFKDPGRAHLSKKPIRKWMRTLKWFKVSKHQTGAKTPHFQF